MNVHAPQAIAAKPKQREQRRQPRFKLPAGLRIDGVDAAVTDWSEEGVGFVAPGLDLVIGETLDGELFFAFTDTNLFVPIIAEVRHFDRQSGRGGLSYEVRSDDDRKSIASVIEGYLAGRIDVMDGLLTKNDTLRAAPAPRSTAAAESGLGVQLRRAFGLATITCLGGLAAYFLGTSVYDRLFVFDAASAQVSYPTVDAIAPAGGTLSALAAPGPISTGTTLFSITDELGTVTDIPSPCTCDLLRDGRRIGELVPAGATVLKLVQSSSNPTVKVSVAFPDLRRVYEGASVDLKYLDGSWVQNAKVVSIEGLDGKPAGLATIEVEPGRTLTPQQFGEPVYARFDTAPWGR